MPDPDAEVKEGEEPKTKTVPRTSNVWETVNSAKPLWMRDPKELTESECDRAVWLGGGTYLFFGSLFSACIEAHFCSGMKQNIHFAACVRIYKMCTLLHHSKLKNSVKFRIYVCHVFRMLTLFVPSLEISSMVKFHQDLVIFETILENLLEFQKFMKLL